MAVAQTKSSEIIDKLNAVLSEGRYADPNSFQMRAILRDCEHVRAADPASGWSLLGNYFSLLGEAEEVDRCYRASQALQNLPIARDNYHTNLTNLGYFSRAHEFYKANGTPESGIFSLMSRIAFTSGSFHTFVKYYDAAKAMNMDLSDVNIGNARRVVAVLSAAGMSDEQVTKHMDAAGVVLRRHKLFFEGDGHVEVADEPGVFQGVTQIFRLRLSAEQVFELNMELAAVEEELQVEKSPVFDVVFLPA